MNLIIASTILLVSLAATAQDFPLTDMEHPFTGETFSEKAIGEAYQTRSWRNRYLNRVVTLYNVSVKEEPLPNAPAIHEACHDDGDRFANWSRSETFFRTFNAGVDFSLLGLGFNLGGEYGREFGFSYERWVIATEGIEAIHRPMISYQILKGESYLQTINLKTGESYNTPLDDPAFYADYVAPVLKVKREILQRCADPAL